MRQKELLVSIVNALIEKYCEKYPDEYCFDGQGLGMTKSGRILDADGGNPVPTLKWILDEIIPDLT